MCRVCVVLTWRSCEHDGEQVDAHSDGVEDGKSSEAVGNRISLRRSGCEHRHVCVTPEIISYQACTLVYSTPCSYFVQDVFANKIEEYS